MKKKKFITYVIICVCIFLVLWAARFTEFFWLDYWKVVGLPKCNFNYNDLIAKKGKPLSIEYTDDESVYLVYKGVKFYMSSSDFSRKYVELLNATLTDSTYSFGRNHISIGSSRDDVISYFKGAKETLDSHEDEISYHCNFNTYIHFEFDEEDKVKSLILTREIP